MILTNNSQGAGLSEGVILYKVIVICWDFVRIQKEIFLHNMISNALNLKQKERYIADIYQDMK